MIAREAPRLLRGGTSLELVHWKSMKVELLGMPRERAGVAEVNVAAATLGQLFAALVARYPGLDELVNVDRQRPLVVANLNGDAFISDPDTPLRESDSVLILSADAGG